jgi:hypothetical protein
MVLTAVKDLSQAFMLLPESRRYLFHFMAISISPVLSSLLSETILKP